jgi:hypothetical protein
MKTSRRKFISTSVAGGLAATIPGVAYTRNKSEGSNAIKEKYAALDKILGQPVLKRELFQSPVIIESLELLRLNNNFPVQGQVKGWCGWYLCPE